jgi:hypothetical protein
MIRFSLPSDFIEYPIRNNDLRLAMDRIEISIVFDKRPLQYLELTYGYIVFSVKTRDEKVITAMQSHIFMKDTLRTPFG